MRQLGSEAIDGSLTEVLIRCGRDTCLCATDQEQRHKKHHLTKTTNGKTTCTYVRKEHVKQVQQWCENYRTAKRVLKELGTVNHALIRAIAREQALLRKVAKDLKRVD